MLTGIGMVTPLGNTREETWEGVIAGRSGGGSDHDLPAARRSGPLRLRGQGLRPDRRPWTASSRAAPTATASSCSSPRARRSRTPALDVTADGLGERTGTAVATGIGGLQTLDLAHEHLFAKGIDRMSPLWITMLIPNMGAAMVSMEYGFRGPSSTVTHRLRGLVDGDRRCRRHDPRRPRRRRWSRAAARRRSRRSASAASTRCARSRSATTTPRRPAGRSTLGRDGFVIGEGSTIVVIEELEHARARGARIYAEIMGYGCTADAHHFTEPDPTGVNPARAMRLALEEAGMQPERDRLHQRARHVDAGRRHRRDARDQDGARRGARLRGADLLDQVDDGPHARRRRLDGARDHGARALPRRPAADDQPVRAPIPSATWTTCRTTRAHGVDARVGLSNGFGFGGPQRVADHRALGRGDGRRVS